MEKRYKNIILRDYRQSDIEDYVRWFTSDTEWTFWDAPWEEIESDETSERESWTEYFEMVKDLPDSVTRWKFEIECEGKHLGWVSSYLIDENHEWISSDGVKEGQTVYRAVGIDICEKEDWCKGIGTNALYAFLQYYFERGDKQLYAQTWSGNFRMIGLAKKLGFEEVKRELGNRRVRGEVYDGLTFRLDVERFKNI